MQELITGIQQAGIGVSNADEAKILYRDLFGMDVLVFDDIASACLMKQYTGGKEHQRRALLTLNLQGGGGFEIWQFLSRKPVMPFKPGIPQEPGIYAVKIKTADIQKAYRHCKAFPQMQVSEPFILPDQRPSFWVIDRFHNRFQIIETPGVFKKTSQVCGGVIGAVITVSEMEQALQFYKQLLPTAFQVYQNNSVQWNGFQQTDESGLFHQILLHKPAGSSGAFSKLLGHTEIELVQSAGIRKTEKDPGKYWGDCGFIHLCFDVLNMDLLRKEFEAAGYFFTVDSKGSFQMSNASGRFCYLEDPDGTLIELVETHQVPVWKKIGWNMDLTKRLKNKPLPRWMIGLLALGKVK
ncbi:MAG: VOC family protein [Bacteroidota bacterium]|nr:VOC family protein [Bacteroidota bacterium]